MKLEHQQHKLLQAHYENAIPVELLRKEQQRITHSLTAANHRIQTLEQDLEDKEELVSQALDIAQHMASAYHHAPNHIRRMLNQLLFEHVYLVPYDGTSQLTATAACMPPFDSILGLGGDEDGHSHQAQHRPSQYHGVTRSQGVMRSQTPDLACSLRTSRAASNRQKPTSIISRSYNHLFVQHNDVILSINYSDCQGDS